MMTKRKDSAEKAIRDIRRVTRRQYSAEEKIRIVPEGLRGESSNAELCRSTVRVGAVLCFCRAIQDRHIGHLVFIDVASGNVLQSNDLGALPLEAVVTSDSKTLGLAVPGNGSFMFFGMEDQNRISTPEGLPGDLGTVSVAVSNNLCH
jgi:hypothetical protein